MDNLVKDIAHVNKDPDLALVKNDQASKLLALLIEVIPISEISALFETIVRHVKTMVDFDAADLLFFENTSAAKHNRLSYSKAQFYEFLNVSDPSMFDAADSGILSRHFTRDHRRQTSDTYWEHILPHDSLFFKKETEFKYSYFIPVTGVNNLNGLLQFRTNKHKGFDLAEHATFQLIEKILLSKLNELLKQSVTIDRGNTIADKVGFPILESGHSASLALNFELASIRTKEDLELIIHHRLNKFLPDGFIQIYKCSNNGKSYHPFIDSSAGNKDSSGLRILEEKELPAGITCINSVDFSVEPTHVQLNELRDTVPGFAWLKEKFKQGFTRAIFFALGNHDRRTGLMIIFVVGEVDTSYINKVKELSWQISAVLNNIIANEKIADQFKEIEKYKQQLETENHYLQEEIETTYNYGDIIGTSEAMKKIFFLVSQVAETQSSVLILGETGTGKELIARALHSASPRRKKLMVKINCAALPANLIESELFGHEKGSFTGASDRRIGKFELANNSTLFLDEVGELPLDLQVKLLRALQENEIERIGGTSVIKVNVRIVAATNRNLLKEVHSGNFRSDLYFRLNVFPIMLPPLRDRKDDIPLLAAHFLGKQSKRITPVITGFSSKAIKQLKAYDWPGNVRELEHLIERCALLTKGTIINQLPVLLTGNENSSVTPDIRIKTIDEIEREHIMFVLKKCENKVAGIGGAADVLKIPASTLNSKMRRLKIKRGYTES